MTTTTEDFPFKGEIRITLDADELATVSTFANQIHILSMQRQGVRSHAVYVVDEDGNEIEGA